MTDIVWGADIPIVDGKKPEWLGDDDRILFENTPGDWMGGGGRATHESFRWGVIDGASCPLTIRLPVNHPHYAIATWKPDPRTVQACAEHIANLPVCVKFGCTAKAIADELIEALLPDPDIAEARKIVKVHYPEMSDDYFGRRIDIAVDGLRRGRELAMNK